VSGLVDDIAVAAQAEGVRSAVAAARDGIDALLRDRGPRRTTPELVTESLLRGAAASARLEGSATDLEDLRRGAGDPFATSAARLNAGLLSLVPVIGRSPLQVLARMHTLAAAGHVDPERLGRPRPGDCIASRLQGLCTFLLAPTTLSGIVVAAVAHAEIIAIGPFDRCNGLVARALERLVLVSRGVDPTSMLVPEAGHLALEADYAGSLAAYQTEGPMGRRAWLLHGAKALTRAAELSPLR
jgi:hypothetical protein